MTDLQEGKEKKGYSNIPKPTTPPPPPPKGQGDLRGTLKEFPRLRNVVHYDKIPPRPSNPPPPMNPPNKKRKIRINWTIEVTCPACKGQGAMRTGTWNHGVMTDLEVSFPCDYCKNTGRVIATTRPKE